MSDFRPTRASPPSKHVNIMNHRDNKLPTDVSRSSTTLASELMGLSQDEVELLDAVIERAGPLATTFLTVFKAYNDVLNERGLDPHEVLYYGKLLKLGTIKGKHWADKWNAIKSQHSYRHTYGDSDDLAQHYSHTQGLKLESVSRRVINQTNPPYSSEDASTLHSHSHDEESDAGSSIAKNNISPNQRHSASETVSTDGLHAPPSKPSFTMPGYDRGNLPLSAPAHMARMRRHQQSPWEAGVSDDSEGYVPSTTPPSYRAAIYDVRLSQEIGHLRSATETRRLPPAAISSAAAHKVVSMAKERRGSVINDEDAWNKIKMQRDESDADEFRADRLQERCWEVWKQGFRWIITTNKQVGEAHDNLLLRMSFQRWRNIAASGNDLLQRVTSLSNNRRLRRAFDTWRVRLKEKEQHKWRSGMRMRMKAVKDKRELVLRKDAWAKWRQSYCSHFSKQHYAERLVLRFYYRWKQRLSAITEMEVIASNAYEMFIQKAAERCWRLWLNANNMRTLERVMAERVGLRLMGETLDKWHKNAYDRKTAEEFHRLLLLRTTLRSWKTSRDRIRTMTNRAIKYVVRQDSLLLRAVTRVWKARERGRLLERVKAIRLIKDFWSTWKLRVQRQKENNDMALAFSHRINFRTIVSGFQGWQKAHITHQNSHSFAVQYESAQLRYKMLLSWRIQLREKLKLGRIARIADKFFASRRAWKTWRKTLDLRIKEKRVKELDKRRLEQVFHAWLYRTQQEKQRSIAEQIIKNSVIKRTLKHGLAIWTNRVIEIKLRELEVTQQHDNTRQTLAFKKWKNVFLRHVEELRLMESYQFVKREETMRRLFNRWQSLARTNRHRRITLKKKEDEMKFAVMADAWEKWRDRFIDEKLRSIEYNVTLQTQKNMLFRAFGIWHSKTKSLPAIRFHAINVKSHFFGIWRRGMPGALQAKKAREHEKRTILSKFLDKWVQSHRTKMALKAVARARYLRLPTAAPRHTRAALTVSSTIPPASQKLVNDKGLTQRSIGSADARNSITIDSPKRRPRSEQNSGPAPRTRRDLSPTRSRLSLITQRSLRDTSPTRSVPESVLSTSGQDRKSRLWIELHEVQRKSRPSSRTREPP